MKSFYMLIAVSQALLIFSQILLLPLVRRKYRGSLSLKVIKEWASSGERLAKLSLLFIYIGFSFFSISIVYLFIYFIYLK